MDAANVDREVMHRRSSRLHVDVVTMVVRLSLVIVPESESEVRMRKKSEKTPSLTYRGCHRQELEEFDLSNLSKLLSFNVSLMSASKQLPRTFWCMMPKSSFLICFGATSSWKVA